MKPTKYVLGFMFQGGHVLMIKKDHPKWQAGLMNGIGGKIIEGETPAEAMVREFEEEAGVKTTTDQWSNFCLLSGGDWSVAVFACLGDLFKAKTMTSEKVVIMGVNAIAHKYWEYIENIPWLVELALDHLDDGRPSFVKVEYP